MVRDCLILVGTAVVSTLVLWMAVGMKTIYQNFDGPYYAVIAKCWYDKECVGKNFSFPLPSEYYPAHFPLYPMAMWLGGLIVENSLLAGVLINLAATIGVAVVLYKMAGEKLWIALAWLFWWPRMWVVRSVGGAETLLMLGLLGSTYFFMKKRYWPAALLGVLAVLAKPPGILLFVAYVLTRPKLKMWPFLLMPLSLLGVFWFYGVQTGDFWAYFHSGDNIHLQALPFGVFDSNQPWVGTFWLEDVLWVYLVGLIGVIRAMGKNKILGYFGAVFYATILFVSHRDIARYSLPLVPVVLIGLSEIFERREVRWALVFLAIPMFFYSVNFLLHNQVAIPDWGPFL